MNQGFDGWWGARQTVVGKKKITETSRKWVFNDASDITTFYLLVLEFFSFLEAFLKNSQYVNWHLTYFSSTTNGPLHFQHLTWEFLRKLLFYLKMQRKTSHVYKSEAKASRLCFTTLNYTYACFCQESGRHWLWAGGLATLRLFKASWVLSPPRGVPNYISFSVWPFTSFEHWLEGGS